MLSDLVEAAAAQGFECRVVCCDRSYAQPQRRYAAREERPGVSVRRIRATGFGRASAAGRLLDYASYLLGAAFSALRGPSPRLVVGLSTPPLLGVLAVAIARLRGARAVYWVMDVYPDLAVELGTLAPGARSTRALRALSRWALLRADLVVALGEEMERRLKRLAPAANVVVVHNWADERAFAGDAAGRDACRAARGWSDSFVALYSGNLGLAHEFDTVLAAAERLRASPDILFAFVGTGPRRRELEAAAGARGLANVRFLPPVPRDELEASLASADVQLITLKPGIEGLLVPSKIYGILASGRPCLYVGPRRGEVFEILRAAGCGTCLDPGDALGVAAALRSYRDDAPRRMREGQRARAAFLERFTRGAQTGRLLGALRALAERPGR